MRRIHRLLYNNYEYWRSEMGACPYSDYPDCITIDDALRAHYLLVDYFMNDGEKIGNYGPRNRIVFLSALDRQIVGLAEVPKWNDGYEKAATLFFGIIKDHVFHDGNKRTGLLAALYLLEKIKRTPKVSATEFENLAVRTAASQLKRYPSFERFAYDDDAEVKFIAWCFRRWTRRIETNLPSVTFNQMATVLKRHGFELSNPSGNYISIVKNVKKAKHFGFSSYNETVTVAQVGFPSWKSQVSESALRTILRETGLTQKNGYDMAAIFGNADSLDSLIDTYKGPLKRLKDR